MRNSLTPVLMDDTAISEVFDDALILAIYDKIRVRYSFNSMYSFISHTSQRPNYIYKRC
jgi:hypothetical protein